MNRRELMKLAGAAVMWPIVVKTAEPKTPDSEMVISGVYCERRGPCEYRLSLHCLDCGHNLGEHRLVVFKNCIRYSSSISDQGSITPSPSISFPGSYTPPDQIK